MKINWQNPSASNDIPLTERDIELLKEKILKKQTGNCFSLYLYPKEIVWLKDNIENGIVKDFRDKYPVEDGKILTFIGVDEFTIDEAFAKI